MTAKPKKFDRIARVLTLSMALRLLVVTGLATLIGFLHIRSIVSDLISQDLASFVRMWGDRENQVFVAAENSQASLARRFAAMGHDPILHKRKFTELFERRPDGTIHENASIDNLNHPSFFIPKSLGLDAKVEERAMLYYDFLDRECYLTLANFSDCWVAMSDGMLGVFYPNSDGYSDSGQAEFQKLSAVKAASAARPESRWTEIYFDSYVKKWMISLTTPIQLDGGVTGAIGKDIFLNDLLERTVKFEKPGTQNFIFTAQGLVIAHPDFEKSILEQGHGVQAEALDANSPVRRAYEIAKSDPSLSKGAVFTKEGPYILALEHLEAPDWYVGTTYPASLVEKAAFSASRVIIVLGLFILGVELVLVLLLLRRRLERPIEDLVRTIGRVREGDLTAKADIHTNDEFEILSESFNDMTYDIQLSRTELEAALKKANQASEAKSQFVANMSHEMRTPLAGILGVTQLMRDTPLSEEQAKYTNIIDESGTSLLAIINQILDVAKFEAKSFILKSEVFNMQQVFENVRAACSENAQFKGLQLDLQNRVVTPHDFWGDVGRLSEVLCNLVGNAIKYSAKGAISLVCEIADEREGKTKIKFEVRDQGPGIPADVQPHLFKPFTQADASNTRVHGGTGLGLYLCQEIIAMMGGSLSFESKLGVGTTFLFAITFENRVREAVAAARAPGTTDLAQVKPVLIVEDTNFNQVVAQAFLNKIGLRSELADNGKVAVDLFESGRYSLILMDCQMPVMDGYEATGRIRKKEKGAAIPIIALTAKTAPHEREKCLGAGMDDLLTKPVKLNLLSERIIQWLERTGQI